MAEFVVSSELSADSATVWRHAVSPDGVNRELRPLLRMTFPPGVRDLTSGWQRGERRFRSWLLLAGVLPVEYDDLVFEAFFRWRHRRLRRRFGKSNAPSRVESTQRDKRA